MAYFLIFLLAVECTLIFKWGIKNRQRYLQFPILSAFVFLGWLIPQFLGLTNNYGLPYGSLEKAVVMAILCLGAAHWGYLQNRQSAKLFLWTFNRRRLLQGSAFMSLMGAFFFFKVGQLAADASAAYGGAWTGIITIYVFFSQMLSIGFAIALILHLQRPTLGTWLILGFDLVFYFDRIFISGRRADAAELLFMVFFALWFCRRWAPPKSIVFGVFIMGALIVNSAGDYRAAVLDETGSKWSGAGLESVLAIDFSGNLQRIVQGSAGVEEVRNAVLHIEAVDRRLSFDFGFSLWNAFLHQYVPTQIVGSELKNLLYINLEKSSYLEFAHIPNTGTTLTGLADSFSSFWFFGAIKFFLIGYIMNRWFRAANEGNFVAQLIVMLTMGAALHAITHTTHQFFLVFLKLAIFMIPVLIYSKFDKKLTTYSSSN